MSFVPLCHNRPKGWCSNWLNFTIQLEGTTLGWCVYGGSLWAVHEAGLSLRETLAVGMRGGEMESRRGANV